MTDTFDTLGLKRDVLDALASLEFTEPTDVQKAIIPSVLAKKNIAFTSQTGSGKTLGFSLGFFSRLNPKHGVQMLVVVPTRELCLQVGTELKKFGDILNFKVGMLYGGHNIKGDFITLSRRLQVVVATPGRLIEHINLKSLKVGEVNYMIFDESDQMFDNGFLEDCTYVRSRISSTAQIILSSATITPKVEMFLKKSIKKFELVEVGALIPPNILQDVLFCEIVEKKKLITDYFLGEEFERAIVFVNTKARLSSVHANLNKNKISAALLSSDLTQKEREKCLRDFKAKKFAVLVCTDVASRGLDIENVDIVINYDVPPRSEFYVHRIGRTGRKGLKGYALTFICPEDEENFIRIEEEFDLSVCEVNHQFILVDD